MVFRRLAYWSILVLPCGLTASPVVAGGAILYGYDSLGRVINAGSRDGDTSYYVLDRSGNRVRVRCCETIGGLQVKEDGFDPYFYLQTYSDVRAVGVDPYEHWLRFGASENRMPNRFFQTAWYRAKYGLSASENPLTEYSTHGWKLGRDPSPKFSTSGYHAAYPDTVNVNPLVHFLRWGYGEGRISFPTDARPVVSNSSCEAPAVGGGYQYAPSVSGVVFAGATGVSGNGSPWGFGVAPDGNQVCFLQSDTPLAGASRNYIDFTVSGLTPGVSYTVAFKGARRPGFMSNQVVVSFRGSELLRSAPASNSFSSYVSVPFTAAESSEVIRFSASSTDNGDAGSAIDSITVQ